MSIFKKSQVAAEGPSAENAATAAAGPRESASLRSTVSGEQVASTAIASGSHRSTVSGEQVASTAAASGSRRSTVSGDEDASTARSSGPRISRRMLLTGTAAAAALPYIWIPRAHAQTAGFGAIRHIVYVRLSGGFRFTTAFNGEVDGQFNPFGAAGKKGANTEWGPSSLLERASWLDGEPGKSRSALGMKKVTDISDCICVLPCVDHEPFSGRADGNHGTGLERFLTGFVGGQTSFLTYVNYGLREQVAAASASGKTLLPAFSLGEAGMASGAGDYAAFRPPVLDGSGFERFGFDADSALPKWAQKIAGNMDERMRQRVHPAVRGPVESYQLTREATRQYNKIFNDPLLRVSANSTTAVDGISNQELTNIFGTDNEGLRAALALRLFHFGCPAVFMNQGGYDYHSAEDTMLPTEIDNMNRLISGLHAALHRMQHPEGGTYWDKTLVVFGSEFGRTAQRFNSAGGSDHSSDLATRWMSMPMMGGIIDQAGKAGRQIGATNKADLKATGPVFSYRSMLKTMLDLLGCDHAAVFPADKPIAELFS